MEHKQRWRLLLILLVLFFAIYNVLPTAIYYSKPLTSQIDESKALAIGEQVAERIAREDQLLLDRIRSFAEQAGISFSEIAFAPNDTSTILCKGFSSEDLVKAQSFLPYLGISSSEKSRQFFVASATENEIVLVRRPTTALFGDQATSYFSFIPLFDKDGKPSQGWVDISVRRFEKLLQSIKNPLRLRSDFLQATQEQDWQGALYRLSEKLSDWVDSFGKDAHLRQIVYVSMLQQEPEKSHRMALLLQRLEAHKTEIHNKSISSESKDDKMLSLKEARLGRCIAFLNKVQSQPRLATQAIPSHDELVSMVYTKTGPVSINLVSLHPFFSQMVLDVPRNTISLLPVAVPKGQAETKSGHDMLRTLFFDEVARLSDASGEVFDEVAQDFDASTQAIFLPLTKDNTTKSVLVLNLKEIANKMIASFRQSIESLWIPKNVNLVKDAFPFVTSQEYIKLSKEAKETCLLLFSPSEYGGGGALQDSSIFIVMRGGKKLAGYANLLEGAKDFAEDLQALEKHIEARGFVAWSPNEYVLHPQFQNDLVFELSQPYMSLIEASMENFYIPSREAVALLEFSTVSQRIRRENAIDDHMQEQLVKEKEAWQAAQVSSNLIEQLMHPKPLKNVFWENLKRSARKYFRGDESRVLHWGLDLSGGVSIRVGLVDTNNRPVTDAKDLRQAGNELYARLNKMGVSERTIRVENETISIDFPGVQGVSAEELIQASQMTFHVVNERFSANNPQVAKQINNFLQEVWNEATVHHAQDQDSLNRIAWKKWDLVKRGIETNQDVQTLIDNGFVLQDPATSDATSSFDDAISVIARCKDKEVEMSSWQGHPLIVLFKNFALEGGNLSQVQPSYDPMKGNVLHFSVSDKDSKGKDSSPQEAFQTWTSQFCQENIQGTTREQWSKGNGWRMAVILNGYVISAPHLHSPLKNGAMISGNFSQRDVQRLAKDLEAGSLSFVPKILSEENVSPELGISERNHSIAAAIIGIILVMSIMITYYRFSGVVASIAVLFNILVLWAVLQNIDAVMTLPALAGFVLTIGMAVDANVLVFERIREELKNGAALASAITLGYKRAFSAIFDSNITTIIAAFVLIQFDSGPVRGFATTLIIGILSSMFTALFVTRYCFYVYLDRVKDAHLKMAEFIKSSDFPFYKYTKTFLLVTGVFIFVSGGLMTTTWRSLLGMDFTGGYSVVIDEPLYIDTSLKDACQAALQKAGVAQSEFHIRILGRTDAIRLQLSSHLDEKDHLFFETKGEAKLQRLEQALQMNGVTLSSATKDRMAKSWTAISGQFSDGMKKNAVFAISTALFAILIYIALRFELKYALSSIAAFVYNALVTCSVLIVAHIVGLDVQFNLEAIGALMTILGYVLNDTIIVFDRVREVAGVYRKKSFAEIINMSLNQTLSRTTMTSCMTLASLLALLVLGGSSIFTFALIMFIGILLGPLSTFFVACPLLAHLHEREQRSESE